MTDPSPEKADFPSTPGDVAVAAYGQASMLLVESLLHGLVAKQVISLQHALEIVEIASDTKEATGLELGDSPERLDKALDILASLSASLRIDLV